MSQHLDELYLAWLYSQIDSVKRKNPSHTYWTLFKILYTTEFVWTVPNDDNRVEDGKDLRFEFFEDCGIDNVDKDWMELGCSMLELLVGLANRAAFEDDHTPRQWFWTMMHNLGLADYNDAVPIPKALVVETLDRIIHRTYQPDGTGGLFPLRRPQKDQRCVELWYQLNAYLLEND